MIEQRTLFRRRLTKFREHQRVYQPELTSISDPPDDDIINVSLFLPSSLSPNLRSKCSPRLIEMEKELRLSQCHDALTSLRLHLHSKSRLLKDKYLNVRHQGPNTKSRALLDRVSAQVSAAAEKYSAARLTLDTLDSDPKAQWRKELEVLNQSDIRGMLEPELQNHSNPKHASATLGRMLLSGGAFPQGNTTTSWIWRGAPTNAEAVSGYNEGSPCFLSLGLI